MSSYEKTFEIEATDIDERNRSLRVKALREVTLFELVEGIHNFISQDRDFEYSSNIKEIVFISSTGNTRIFRQNAYWVNSVTILSDISRQLKI